MKNLGYFGNYEIISQSGSDAFFDSYLALDTIRKRKVALKVFKTGEQGDQKTLQGFLAQAQLAVDLVHPHLAWTWETGEINGKYFLVERLVEGQSLHHMLNSAGKISLQQAQEIIAQVAKGLEFAHSHGCVHGNLHPGKIIINPELGAVLTDLGASLVMQAVVPRWVSVVDMNMAPYTAPELWQSKQPTPASDQYSLACVWAELLSGEKTFEAQTLGEVKEKHLSPFTMPLSWAATIPWSTAKAVLRALDHDPSKRFLKIEALSLAPEKIKAEIKLNPQLKAEADHQARAWQDAKHKARLEAEEIARLAALEKARREIEEELQYKEAILQVEEETIAETSSQIEAETNRIEDMSKLGEKPMHFKKHAIIWFFIALGVSILVAAFAPLEKTLGTNARLVYFHGAWVWTAMLAFSAAAIAGALGLITRRANLHAWSMALGRTGLFFWILFLPMSLWVMQANWNGLFLDEPRFRIPLNFAIVGLLLQVGLSFISVPVWSSIGNILYGGGFFWGMTQVETVLHPDSPIFSSDAHDIQVYFIFLFILLTISALFLAYAWLNRTASRIKSK